MLQDSKVRGGAAIQISRGGKYDRRERWSGEREELLSMGEDGHRGRHDKKGLVRVDYPWKSSREKRLICRGGNGQRKTRKRRERAREKKQECLLFVFVIVLLNICCVTFQEPLNVVIR